MTDKYDRGPQRKLLLALYDARPHPVAPEVLAEIERDFGTDDCFTDNIIYLKEHGLIDCHLCVSSDGTRNKFSWGSDTLRLTAAGVDFVRNDGGLGAILNVQTIRLHDDTIGAIEDIISSSNIPEGKKTGLISKLRELPADAIKHLILQLLTQGVQNLPVALQLIEKALRVS
ncbi:hypothetical protein AABD69_08950 [Edwardsiella piscicida]|uniref:Uncharacterized protein n=1 Tax=Edwardsiella phage GF-2 TaxID=1537091 RepID=A0A077K9U2_9CAUD|nr:hypothetical protein [Edwardsiella piscicida]YP_009126623.1 hypothetical protein VC56_gp20 [Edwardsiella phage GF-2]ELM3659810.1 hypothetical protein [Edwardsiella piscicida]UCQ36384.1 hypothetical protein DCF36_08980 [Edwardsiella piscicida]BAP28891.1 hypothetical protein [Edwardsiella phage GF-2]